tara:strand:+ start:4624 stop:4992 length:369 start_codon:yes stop_codon:yes gene_type:complete
MKQLFSLALLMMLACGPAVTHVQSDQEFSGRWLQLDQYFPVSCFILDEETKTVWVFDEGEEEQTHKDDWLWVFSLPNLYTFNGSIDLHAIEIENSCWLMSIWGVDVNACPCSFVIPDKPPEE